MRSQEFPASRLQYEMSILDMETCRVRGVFASSQEDTLKL